MYKHAFYCELPVVYTGWLINQILYVIGMSPFVKELSSYYTTVKICHISPHDSEYTA